jgi:hypothetical protein
MPSLCTYARSQSLSPLVDSRVNNVLLQTMPDANEALLQRIDVVHTTFVHSLLHDSPDLVVDGVQVWAVGRPEVRTDEVGRLPLQQLDGVTGAMCRSAVLLVNKRIACDIFIVCNKSCYCSFLNRKLHKE